MGHKVKQSLVSSRIDFFYYAFRNVLLVSIPLLTISALILGLSVSHSSATTNLATDNFTLSIPISCTLTASIKAGEEHSISMVSGQYKADIGKTTMDTTCNDPNGFVVYAIGSSNNEEGDNKLKALTLSDAYDIVSGTAESGNTSNWAMKLTPITNGDFTPTIDNNFTQYSIVPNTWTKIAHKNPGTTDITKKTSFTTTYAVYLESTQPASTYRGQVKYVMFHPSTAAEPTDTLEHAFALAGKSKVQVTDPITGQSGSFYKMQDMTTNICESTTLIDEQNTLQLVDTRDNKLYWVTKLKDGHCWMTQDLDLDLSPSTTLTSNDTDLNDNSMAGAYGKDYSYDATNNVISWTPQNTTRHSATGSGTNWVNSDNVAYSLDPGEWYWDGDDSAPDCNYLNASAGCIHFTQDRTNANRHLSVGNYYNWSAAIASDDSSSLTNSTYGNANSDPNATDRNPQNSICPKGWRLPTISYQGNIVNSTSEFARVNGLYNDGITNNDKKLIASPLWFVRSGFVSYGNLRNPGYGADYWSSTVSHSHSAYYLAFTATIVNPASSNFYYSYDRNFGWSVRCVAR